MHYGLKAGPTTYPVSEAELADLLRLDDYQEPTLKFLLESAVSSAIAYTGRAFLEQTYTIQWDGYPGKGTPTKGIDVLHRIPDEWIELPYPPLLSVESVKTIDRDGLETLIDPTEYVLDLINQPGRLRFKNGYPALYSGDRLVIDYTAGYGDSPHDVPYAIRHGILVAAGYMYEHRGECSAASALMDSGAAQILQPYRMMRL